VESEAFDNSDGIEIHPEDPAVLRVTQKLRLFFEEHPEGVFYETQICIFFEAEFFHWGNCPSVERNATGRRNW